MPRYTYNGVTVTATKRRPSTRDDKKYMRTVTVNGNRRLVHYGDPNLPMRRNNEERQKAFVSRHNCSAKKDPFAPGFWACYDWENTSEMKEAKNFLFVELQGLTEGKPFAGFALGDFVDMFGREVKFKDDDHLEFMTNTQRALAAVKTKNQPGLPIDARNHDKGDAAGWIVGVELGEVTDSKGKVIPALMLLAEWTKLGVELIKDRIQTNFSPTVDLAKKVLRGGSLTNWPASVDSNGIPLFSAIELSEGVRGLIPFIDTTSTDPTVIYEFITESATAPKELPSAEAVAELTNDEVTMTQDEMSAFIRTELQAALVGALKPKPTEGEEVPAEFDIAKLLDLSSFVEKIQGAQQQVAIEQFELAQREANRQAMQHIARLRHKANVTELAQAVTSGTDSVPYGLPVSATDLEEFLIRLKPEDYEFAKNMLDRLWRDGRVAFTELGHGKRQKGVVPVPDYARNSLTAVIAAGNSVQEFFAITGLGDPADYDLSNFKEN